MSLHPDDAARWAAALPADTGTLALLSGGSRGLGAALARGLLRWPGLALVVFSRRPDPALDAAAQAAGRPLLQAAVDLAAPDAALALQAAILAARAPQPPSRLIWLHNAALLPEPGPLAGQDDGQIRDALRVGLEAPLRLSAAALAASAAWGARRQWMFVSSGLGRRAMAGSTVYNACKAGLDHAARSLALELAGEPGSGVVSIAPGVVATDMQQQLRGADPARFPAQAGFAALAADGRLSPPEAAAAQLLAWLEREDYGHPPVADVREP